MPPQVPNPQRAKRLYQHLLGAYVQGGSVATTVHPTTKGKPIDVATRLHTSYWTTNGFCVYKGDAVYNAQTVNSFASPTIVNSEECALRALARATFSGEYGNYTTLWPASSACTEQVTVIVALYFST